MTTNWKRLFRDALLQAGILAGLSSANAFEVTTHAVMTSQAWSRFIASDPGALNRLGLVDLENAFNISAYYDFRPGSGDVAISRNTLDFEFKKIREIGEKPFSISGWLMRGAIREDDDVSPSDESPKEDPRGDFHRVFSHFHDPVNDRGLFVAKSLGAKASDWALAPDASTPFFIIDGAPQRYNSFNLATFHEAQWVALTGTDKAGTKVAFNSNDRNTYWATAFRALGDIVHLNQDMAQPQHTRNDGHTGRLAGIIVGHKSVFERYTDARVRGILGFSNRDDTADPNIAINPQPVTYAGYPMPSFTQYSDYWATTAKTGLADYSNKGFFSIGTLPSNWANSYTFPSKDESTYTEEKVTITRWSGQEVSGWIPKATLFIGSVPDATGLQPAASNVPLFAKSIWEESRQTLTQPLFGPLQTLTKANYDAAIDLLIPRAVAYSAGILQHAFRGRLEVKPPDEGVYSLVDHFEFSGANQTTTAPMTGFKGFKTIKLKLRNATPDIGAAPQIMPGGTLVAVLKFHRNNNYVDDLSAEPAGDTALDSYIAGRSSSEEIVVSSRVKDAAGATLGASIPVTNTAETLFFEFDQELPINATDVYLQVVYRGVLGNETDAVVVQTVNLSEPTYLTYMNDTDYVKLGGSVYTLEQIATDIALIGQVRPLIPCLNSSENQLTGACFKPLALSHALKWWNPGSGSSGSAQTNATVALPAPKTYHRFAMLTPLDAPAIIDQSANLDCQPNTPIPVPGRQLQIDIEGNPPANVAKIVNVFPGGMRDRGVKGFVFSCVHIGDGSPPGSPDDRATKMSELPEASLKPKQASGFNFRAPTP